MNDRPTITVRRRAARVGLAAFLGAGLAFGGFLLGVRLSGNFHAVVEGEIYRSAQPGAEDIAAYAEAYGIRTIVNLRGEDVGADWYDEEVAAARRHGLAHVDFRMSAERELTRARAEELIAVLARAEKPVLIHCNAGADRSGLAAALYVAAVAKLGEEAAESQISLRYGHLSIPISGAFAMDRTFEALEPWLGYLDS